ncbi:transposase [Streptomyces sp. NPDC048191]|uniref:transposase n=1 Tax=Streptomyces sp. NPDC048191 TaxID=3155484 RepID=UPI0033F567CB
MLEHLEALNTKRRTVRYTVGWKITPEDEAAIAKLPESAWETSLTQDGQLQAGYHVAELTGLNTREGWPDGMRLIVRRVRPSGRQMKKLTDFEKRTGWWYSISATSIRHLWGIAGSHQIQFLDAFHRDHAEVEDRVRTNKTMDLANLPSTSWDVNTGWMLAANLACDLDAWFRLLTLHDHDELTHAEPQTMRFRLTAGPLPQRGPGRKTTRTLRARGTRRSRGVTRRPAPHPHRTLRANRRTGQRLNPADESRPRGEFPPIDPLIGSVERDRERAVW